MSTIASMNKIPWKQFSLLEHQVFKNNPMHANTYAKSKSDIGFVGLFLKKELIGYLHLKSYGKQWHIKRMAVTPRFQRQGYGSQLLNWAISLCKTNQAKNVTLFVNSNNRAAIALYHQKGFRSIETTTQFTIHFDQAINLNQPYNFNDYHLAELQGEELSELLTQFNILDPEKITTWIRANTNDSLLLLRNDDGIRAFGKYSPMHSGCMPFVYNNPQDLDAFIRSMYQQIGETTNTFSLSITASPIEIKRLCSKPGFKIFKELLKMELQLA